ncbi:hypothetical protein THAOC_06405 [Thalassiosira oceanica]|uniref:Uncharacterized protein n=1 Tax=Thalassiosira oceanica TaxID=159749 RepID=K0T302_THAOC|nr:hypothetical protein THAOC_06405 [Thalassiosira oceanica]|eukprot:EJK72100.1 hypothetical protein THAOC_06405 [Thalassiosira oceanica]
MSQAFPVSAERRSRRASPCIGLAHRIEYPMSPVVRVARAVAAALEAPLEAKYTMSPAVRVARAVAPAAFQP